MVKIAFVPEGQPPRVLDVDCGATLMEAARDHGVPHIVGDCGGEMTCGTCHGYIDQAFLSLLSPPSGEERVMIEDGVANPQSNSRLCCQIVVTSAMDGMTVDIPKQF